MQVLSAAEAAEQLGVSARRVRKMLGDGVLPGSRIGRGWIIEQRALNAFIRHRAQGGRPWQASSAWAALAIADGNESGFSAVERSRARRRLDSNGLAGLAHRLVARAQRRSYYGHPSVLLRLQGEPGLVRSGVSAAADHGADIIVSDFLEAYIASSRAPGVIERYGLDSEAERPNIVLRIVDDVSWPFGPAVGVAPRAVVAVDLLEAEDERSRRAGAALARGSR